MSFGPNIWPPRHYLPPQPDGSRNLWEKLGRFYIDSPRPCVSRVLEEGQWLTAMTSWCQQGALPVAQPQAVSTAAAVATVAMAASPHPSQRCFRLPLLLEVIRLGYPEVRQWLRASDWVMPEEVVYP